jgi:hypothetical protein
MENRASFSNHACDKQPCQDVPTILIQDVHAKLGVHPMPKPKSQPKMDPESLITTSTQGKL